MQIPALSPVAIPASEAPPAEKTSRSAGELGDATQQFEAILLRPFPGASIKSPLEGGSSGQVYGYLLTDSLADSLSKGGGMGLSSVIQAQLGKGRP